MFISFINLEKNPMQYFVGKKMKDKNHSAFLSNWSSVLVWCITCLTPRFLALNTLGQLNTGFTRRAGTSKCVGMVRIPRTLLLIGNPRTGLDHATMGNMLDGSLEPDNRINKNANIFQIIDYRGYDWCPRVDECRLLC